ncbi:nucleotide sugar dehydrogenase [Roseomonas terrae]|uniref:Nucleotide sugar dehydrogenase n=1 Tax=Neoroseomonas terrae TaxID=424799 RepID=A0ABS5EKB5_9PROT|nr:nucleotide sugar dehydrogenase [Neoroseomonas terrae]MBR0651457.1 nucleotide sugar dehydrogenase [Neoroseomonas terrae]
MPDIGLLPDPASAAAMAAREVVVIGLGYVGLPIALEAAAAGFAVTGYDLDPTAARAAEAAARGTVPAGRLLATADPLALPRAGTWLICVPTPLDATGTPDLSLVAAALETCRIGLAPGALVCLVSTCHPGATNGLCRQVLERDGLRVGRDVYLAVSPERENPGGEAGPRRTPRLLGAPDPVSLARARGFWDRITDQVIPVATPEIAECAKLLENTYRLVNIALIDELHRGFAALGVPTRAVVEAAATKPFGFAPFWPGAGAGGHCIPVDPAFLQMELARAGATSTLLAAAAAANGARPGRILAALEGALGGSVAGRRVLVLGVTYKPDVPDLRGAAPVELVRMLLACGAEVLWHDPVLGPEADALREARRVPGIAVPGLDAAILGTPHRAYDLARIAATAPLVLDPFGVLPAGQARVV